MQMSTRRFDPDTRSQLALRFSGMYKSLGLDLPGCAKLLHVTDRTLHNWMSGKHDIPYSAYRLLRLLNRMELPGESWQGWCFHGGKLWSPEGRSFTGKDAAWWSLLVRRSAMATELRQQVAQLGKVNRSLRNAMASAEGGPACGDASTLANSVGGAANHPNFEHSPMVITGRTYGVSHYEISLRGAYAIR